MDQTKKILMLSIALIFDLIEKLLLLFWIGIFVNRILTLIEYTIFGIWFYMEDIKFMGKGNTGSPMGVTFITEMIPFLGALPGLTVGVYLSIKNHEAVLKKTQQESILKSVPAQGGNVLREKRG